jgi:hypothetical protein
MPKAPDASRAMIDQVMTNAFPATAPRNEAGCF